MTGRVLPSIKRFFEGTANMVFAPSPDSRSRKRPSDFMTQDLTGSARFYGR
jgi:hypothetical protein